MLYALIVGGLGYGGLAAYRANFRTSKKGRPGKARLPTGTEVKPQLVSTPGGGKYEAEWIPKSHVKKGSGADSGGETSGAEGKTRRRKR